MGHQKESDARIVSDDLLRKAGWDPADKSMVETEVLVNWPAGSARDGVPVPDGASPSSGRETLGRADYLLRDQRGRALAVIEARKSAIHPYAAKQQALPYAKQLGAPFIFLTNGESIYFWYYPNDDARAGYGEALMERLARDLASRFGRGFSYQNLNRFRQFYLTFPLGEILSSPMREFSAPPEELPLARIAARFPPRIACARHTETPRNRNAGHRRRQSMARVSTYLNFPRTTEEAFQFYKSVFGTEFSTPIARFKDIPAQPGQPPLPEADKNLVMHVELPILAGHVLMGTDAPESMGFTVTAGNNMYINLEPDTRAETDRLFKALSAGGTVEMPLQEMFWGGYFGSLADRYGIRWMFNCANKA